MAPEVIQTRPRFLLGFAPLDQTPESLGRLCSLDSGWMFTLSMPLQVIAGAEAIDPRASWKFALEWFRMPKLMFPVQYLASDSQRVSNSVLEFRSGFDCLVACWACEIGC